LVSAANAVAVARNTAAMSFDFILRGVVSLACAGGARRRLGAGHFGPYGGIFVPETLMAALEELEAVYKTRRGSDPAFQAELGATWRNSPGGRRPSTSPSA
jgi:hypothetical protein